MTKVEKLGKYATPCNAKGQSFLKGIRGTAKLVSVKLEGTTLEMTGDGTATITLPKKARPGQGGGVLYEDGDGRFRVSVVMPGDVSEKDF